jgi:hypothetical protein
MESIQKISSEILKLLQGNSVALVNACDFSGSDILPADICFFGCEEPYPVSFAYFADVLRHINLAGRPCGIFTHRFPKTVRYLASLVRDSELALNPRPFFAVPPKFWAGASGAELEDWVESIVRSASQGCISKEVEDGKF